MSIPTPVPAGSPDLVPPAPGPWQVLAACLTVTWPDRLPALQEALDRLRDTGARVFEVVVGSPAGAYGPRVTLDPGPDVGGQARRLGFADHPWGPPSWYGLRVGPGGAVTLKPYHRAALVPTDLPRPPGLPDGLVTELAALVGGRCEQYLRRPEPAAWEPFAEACAALVGAPAPRCRPAPAARPWAHAVSLRTDDGVLSAVTLYAEDRCLPGDAGIVPAWSEGLDRTDRRAYEAAVGGVRALGGEDPHGVHAMLAWSVEADGARHRSVSLRISDRPGASSSG